MHLMSKGPVSKCPSPATSAPCFLALPPLLGRVASCLQALHLDSCALSPLPVSACPLFLTVTPSPLPWTHSPPSSPVPIVTPQVDRGTPQSESSVILVLLTALPSVAQASLSVKLTSLPETTRPCLDPSPFSLSFSLSSLCSSLTSLPAVPQRTGCALYWEGHASHVQMALSSPLSHFSSEVTSSGRLQPSGPSSGTCHLHLIKYPAHCCPCKGEGSGLCPQHPIQALATAGARSSPPRALITLTPGLTSSSHSLQPPGTRGWGEGLWRVRCWQGPCPPRLGGRCPIARWALRGARAGDPGIRGGARRHVGWRVQAGVLHILGRRGGER